MTTSPLATSGQVLASPFASRQFEANYPVPLNLAIHYRKHGLFPDDHGGLTQHPAPAKAVCSTDVTETDIWAIK